MEQGIDVSLPPLPSRYFHAIPLHYLPLLLSTGTLYSQRRAAELCLPLRPRPTATRRDRQLRLDCYIHLSPTAQTPLLADKRRRGYPHALLAFTADVANFPNAAYLRFNPKAWRHRADFEPVTDSEGKSALLADWQQGRYPSLELLLPDALPLTPYCEGIYAASRDEETWIRLVACVAAPAIALPIVIDAALFPEGAEPDLQPLYAYATACLSAGMVLPPPDLPFD